MTELNELRLIGMLHLLPLPGSPGYGGSRDAIRERMLRDAEALQKAGFDALLLENFGDMPFYKDEVPPATVAEMAVLAEALRRSTDLPLGVQVLRNDAAAALSVAAAAGAQFIRVNVHTGAMLTDQGVIEGWAAQTLRLRDAIRCDVRVLADVMVKHAVPLAPTDIADAARDAAERGGADGLIVSGRATGAHTDLRELEAVRKAVRCPVFVGSGATAEQAAALLQLATGIIVGTSVKVDGISTNPVDVSRAAAFVNAARREH
jgi:membrane complex biogenesis BtpA family protein